MTDLDVLDQATRDVLGQFPGVKTLVLWLGENPDPPCNSPDAVFSLFGPHLPLGGGFLCHQIRKHYQVILAGAGGIK
jgi:hypothetical protein